MFETFGPHIATLETRAVHGAGPVTIQQIQQKYQQFNAKYFQNKLPHIGIRFAQLPGDTAGLTTYTAIEQGGKKTVEPKTVVVSINDMFKSPNVHYGSAGGVDTILLHEMTHVLMAIMGHIDEKHGQRFRSWLQKLSAVTGYDYSDLMGKQQPAESQEIHRIKTLAGI